MVKNGEMQKNLKIKKCKEQIKEDAAVRKCSVTVW